MRGITTSTRKRLLRARRRRPKQLETEMFRRSTVPLRYDASLRLQGLGAHHQDITDRTGLVPLIAHRRGEPRGRSGRLRTEDIWVLSSPLGERASLADHIGWLWEAIRPHKAYFEELIGLSDSADICLGCLSESAFPFLELGEPALEIMKELKLGFTFNFTCV